MAKTMDEIWKAPLERGEEIQFDVKIAGHDPVNSPRHYTEGNIECIDALHSMLGNVRFEGFCRANAVKYIWRAGLKGDETEDIKKAIWYLRMSIGDDPRCDNTQT